MTTVLLAGAASADTHLAQALRKDGYECLAVPDEGHALQRSELSAADAMIYGARNSDFSFLDHLSAIPVIVISRNPDPRAVVQAIRAGASDYLVRPFSRNELLAALEFACGDPASSQAPEPTLTAMLGECPAMRRLFEHIRKIGPTDSPVLVQGETGTGKELVAQALHAVSARRRLPMLTMNCGAVPEALHEMELFGDATRDPAAPSGLLEAAHNSTLFLDDVAMLTPSAQAKLACVLQSGENRRIGAPATRDVNVRLISACQRELAAAVADGRFREDLFYQLNVVSIAPPPLRDRHGDALLLATHFLARSSKKLGRKNCELTPDAIAAITSYAWPGNVREMENAIERAVILCSDNDITPELLAIDPGPSGGADTPTDSEPNISLEEYFVKFVTENQDNCTETELAERLGISRKSLWERRQRLQIPRKKTRKRAPRRN